MSLKKGSWRLEPLVYAFKLVILALATFLLTHDTNGPHRLTRQVDDTCTVLLESLLRHSLPSTTKSLALSAPPMGVPAHCTLALTIPSFFFPTSPSSSTLPVFTAPSTCVPFPAPDVELGRRQRAWCRPQEKSAIPHGGAFALDFDSHSGDTTSAFVSEQRSSIYIPISLPHYLSVHRRHSGEASGVFCEFSRSSLL